MVRGLLVLLSLMFMLYFSFLLQVVLNDYRFENKSFEKIDCGEKGYSIKFRNNKFSNPEDLISYITYHKDNFSIRPDERIFVKFKKKEISIIDNIKSTVMDLKDIILMKS